MTTTRLRLVFFLVAVFPGCAPQPRPAPVVSPEVHRDNSVTFRLFAPHAQQVLLAREGAPLAAMEKDAQEVWSITTAPLDPDLYGYSFVVDGVGRMDPANHVVNPNLLYPTSMVHVPGPRSAPWELNDVPHGVVHHHFYKSGIVGDDRDFFVYTPPGYDPAARKLYPVLYLLHGLSDDASAWTEVGRAHVILDNLIANGNAKPMVVVMPLGYGAPEILLRGPFSSHPDSTINARNLNTFRDTLFVEVMPSVEKTYRVSNGRYDRAIAGVSMGGGEALVAGLNALDRFAWIGGFSSALLGDDLNAVFPALNAKAAAQPRLIWVACGTADPYLDLNRKIGNWFISQGMHYTKVELPGAHTWLVWRRNLADFVPLLFH
jgi:enterochelin esterase-like enzyme